VSVRKVTIRSDAHTGEDLERIDLQGLNVGALDLNDRQLMAINREDERRVTGNRDESQSVPVIVPRVNLKPSLDSKGHV